MTAIFAGKGELSVDDTYVNSLYPIAPNADKRYERLEFGMAIPLTSVLPAETVRQPMNS